MASKGEENHRIYVGPEVLTTVLMKNSVFRSVKPCSLLNVLHGYISEKTELFITEFNYFIGIYSLSRTVIVLNFNVAET
jgi:hypothetical protein